MDTPALQSLQRLQKFRNGARILGFVLIGVFIFFTAKHQFALMIPWSDFLAEVKAGNVKEVTVRGAEASAVLLQPWDNGVTKIGAIGPSDPLPAQQAELLTDCSVEHGFTLNFQRSEWYDKKIYHVLPWVVLMFLIGILGYRFRRWELGLLSEVNRQDGKSP